MMHLVCLGLSHRSAPVEVRERFAVGESAIPGFLNPVMALPGIEEAVVLSTCNRFELYAATAGPDAIATLSDHLAGHARDRIDLYRHEGSPAARHLYRVASGLDSMVLGETEIFGQVKKAYALAHGAGTTGKHLNRLFQSSFTAGKQVRSKTRIQQGSTSVGSVAVDLAEKIFGNLDHCEVMVLGAGETSRITARSLASRGARSILVSNRSYDRAVELADEVSGEAIRFDDWESRIGVVDILISSTSAPHHLLTVDNVRPALAGRRGRALFLVDIAVPRDIDPAINDLENVYLYDIDHLEQIAAAARSERQRQITLCEEIIEEILSTNPHLPQGRDRGKNDGDPPPEGRLADAR